MEEEVLTSEQYLYKAKGVQDCVKWIEKEIKLAKKDTGFG